MHSCNCDLTGSFHCLLAADIRKIRLPFFLSERKDSISPAVFSFSFPCIEKSNCICQASYTDHPDIFHDQRFVAVFLRHHAGCKAVLLCRINHGQDPAGRMDLTIQTYLSQYQKAVQIPGLYNAKSCHNRNRHRQIIAVSFLSQMDWGKIDRHPLRRKQKTAIFHCRPDSFFRLSYLGGKISYHFKQGQTVTYICLHANKTTLQTMNRRC